MELTVQSVASTQLTLWRQILADYRFYRCRKNCGPIEIWFDRMFWVCLTYRSGHAVTKRRIPVVSPLLRLGYVMLNFVVSTITGADIRAGARIGQRFDVHTCRGLLITNGVTIGDDVTVNAQVCLVNKCNDRGEGVPRIGNGVRLGIGCKVLGGVHVGDRSHVGANAVVIRDVPRGHLAVGVPAVYRRRKDLAPVFFSERMTPQRRGVVLREPVRVTALEA